MKIEGSGPLSPSNIKRKKSSGAQGGDFGNYIDTETSEEKVNTLPPSVTPTPMNPFLSLQEVTNPFSEEAKKAKQKGETMLTTLEEIKIGLLTGNLTEQQFENLSSLMTTREHIAHDTQLDSILSEIEVRAAVELAKFKKRQLKTKAE